MTAQTLAIRTQDDIDKLKRDWRRDPHWDIEDTDGFEAHREELREYRLQMEAQWSANYEERIAQDWLRKAKEAQLNGGVPYDAATLAAIAQAEALTRIADALERMEAQDTLSETVRIWGSEDTQP